MVTTFLAPARCALLCEEWGCGRQTLEAVYVLVLLDEVDLCVVSHLLERVVFQELSILKHQLQQVLHKTQNTTASINRACRCLAFLLIVIFYCEYEQDTLVTTDAFPKLPKCLCERKRKGEEHIFTDSRTTHWKHARTFFGSPWPSSTVT